jgi:hypothetical protein
MEGGLAGTAGASGGMAGNGIDRGGGAGGLSNTGGSAGGGTGGGGAGGGSSGTSSTARDGGGVKPDTPSGGRLFVSNKLDLLLVIDNSISMSDKQAVLSRSISDLVARIVNTTESGVTDLHVGVITSSLGGHGSTDLCAGNDQGTITDQSVNDHGWLIGSRPRFPASTPNALKTTPEGFLAWTSGVNVSELKTGIEAMVVAAGEFGCGLESQLESMYHFLVDPNPYAQLVLQNCAGSTEPCAFPMGTDTTLLAQRKAFLRPNSTVAIVELTDENDCSIREHGQYYYAARDNIILPHGSSACATNPNDPCCYFCNSTPPAGCSADPTCSTQTPRTDDQPNLRCFHQKQRFGFDFLYPTTRYVNALSRTELCLSRDDLSPGADCPDSNGDGKPDLVHNPLFWSSPDPDAGAFVRDPSMVYFLGIVGVPYQDLESSPSATRIDYRTPSVLETTKAWDVILGNAAPSGSEPPILPTDTLLVESVEPRTGSDGETPPAPLAPASAGYLANAVNGHEWLNADEDDLQYSCIFPLPQGRDCTAIVQQNPQPGCDCKPGHEADNNPLCQNTVGMYSTTELFAKAYPPLRELEVIHGLGKNGLVSSICARNLTDDTRQDYAYRPATDLLLSQIRHSAPSP